MVTGRPVDLLAEILLDADVLTDPRNVDVSAALDVLEPADGWHLVTTEELMTGVWELPVAAVFGRGRIGDPGAVADAWRAGVRIEPAYLRAELSDRAELLDRIGVGRIGVSGLPFGCVLDLLELARSLGYAAKKVGQSVLVAEASANPVVSVTPIGEVAGCCIRVGAPDHLYLTEGFVPTHNTVTLNRMLADQIAAGSECVVVDDPAKSVDFLWAKPFLREGGWGCDSDRAAVTALALAYEEGQKRAKVLAEAGVVNWLELPPGEQFTPIFIIVDELSALTVTEKEPTALPKDHPMRMEVAEANLQRVAIMRYISKIIAEERFVGVRIVLSTQVTNAATGVPPALKSKIGHKMLQGSNPSKSARMQAFSDETAVPPVPENVRAAGRVAKGTGGGELEGQAPFVYKSSYAAAADYARELERRGMRRASSPEPSMADIARLAPTLNEDADFDEPAPSRFDGGGFGDPGGHVPELKGAAKANHDRAVEMAQARVKGLDREKFVAQQEAKAQGAHDRPLRTPEEAAAALLG